MSCFMQLNCIQLSSVHVGIEICLQENIDAITCQFLERANKRETTAFSGSCGGAVVVPLRCNVAEAMEKRGNATHRG
jgi:hypothetical protein